MRINLDGTYLVGSTVAVQIEKRERRSSPNALDRLEQTISRAERFIATPQGKKKLILSGHLLNGSDSSFTQPPSYRSCHAWDIGKSSFPLMSYMP